MVYFSCYLIGEIIARLLRKTRIEGDCSVFEHHQLAVKVCLVGPSSVYIMKNEVH